MKKVLILFGGNSVEHDVSCSSAKSILKNIDRKKFKVEACVVSKKNTWYLYQDNIENLNNWSSQNILEISDPIRFLKDFDVVFPIIHGNTGEDGKLQGFLDLFEIPYVGSKTLGSALGMDKEKAKIIFEHYKIPQVPYIFINNNDYNIETIEKVLNYPMIIKPSNGGSSIGISIAKDRKQLKKAINLAYKYDKKIIIEKFIKAREFECAILERKNVYASSSGEIISNREFYDYEAKYQSNSKIIIPADISKELVKKIKEYAIKAFKAIDACGISRLDFLYDEENDNLYLNEINTLPGFTDISMFPSLLINDLYTYKELITEIIKNAL